jgi:hypothetical protein
MRKAIGIAVLLATMGLIAGEALAQKSRSCTTTCYGNSGYRTCTKNCN